MISDHAERRPEDADPEYESVNETEQQPETLDAADVAAAYENGSGDAEKDELREQMMRFAAECENLRRRSEKEVAVARDYAIESFAKDMADVLENLIRALDSANPDGDSAPLIEGVDITRREMMQAFERHHIRRISPLGEKFDHNYHQAVASKAPQNKEPAGTVLEVYQNGYTIKDRLLKPAIVVVAGE